MIYIYIYEDLNYINFKIKKKNYYLVFLFMFLCFEGIFYLFIFLDFLIEAPRLNNSTRLNKKRRGRGGGAPDLESYNPMIGI